MPGYTREDLKRLQAMSLDDKIEHSIVTFYIPSGCVRGTTVARIAARNIPAANRCVQLSRLERQGLTRVPHYKNEKGARRLYVDLYKTIELND